jgi:hypothetical protein
MKLIALLAMIFLGIYLPIAFFNASSFHAASETLRAAAAVYAADAGARRR